MELHQKIRTNPDVSFQEIEGESVLLHLDDARYFGLDDVGTRIWQLIDEHGVLQPVFDRMRTEYEVDPTRLEKDLTRLVAELVNEGLVFLDNDESGSGR